GLYEYLYPFCEAGLDAVIVQDYGVLRFIREHFPDCRLHASTQMTLCGSWGASLLQSMGISRIVPARELSLRELSQLKQNTGVEIEAFIHGAMCCCYSGQCLFSSILGGRSGNRGRCAQPCRLPYSIIGDGVRTGECYPLSLRDMCTVEHIPQLIEVGIDSFKIEGRMKKPEYAAGVTEIYRKYMDRYYELRERKGPEDAAEAYHVEKADWKILTSLYIRTDVQDGYYFRHNDRDMMTLQSPAYSGSDEKLLEEIRNRHLEEPLKLPVVMKASFQTGQQARLSMRWQEYHVSVKGERVEAARNQPVTEENVRKQLLKLGESAFYAASLETVVSEDCFYPLKQINELRRMAVTALEEEILRGEGYGGGRAAGEEGLREGNLSEHRKEALETFSVAGDNTKCPEAAIRSWVFSVRTIPQLKAVAEMADTFPRNIPLRLYVDGDLLAEEWERVCELCGSISAEVALYAALPYILRESDRNYLTELYGKVKESHLFRGFLVRSMDGLGFIRERDQAISCRGDAGLYLWNSAALEEMSDMLEGFCLPYELRASEQRGLLNRLSCEKIIYSRIPMMITANCLLKTADQCRHHGLKTQQAEAGQSLPGTSAGRVILKDRLGKEFPVHVNCGHCMNIIYNSVPFSLWREVPKWRNHADLRMDFTFESPAEVRQLINALRNGMPFPEAEYTTGHEKRGVE
ncbi:MAG: U32 family peptidase, partial [Lachnospiraceae bacterium]|nr:U32 family peptidase [Lachnospiraceae bacterium]